MGPEKASLESLVGYLSVGSLCLLGGFFVLDSTIGIFSVVEVYGASPAWGILAALPTLVISYVFGLMTVTAAELFFVRFSTLHGPDDGEKLVKLALLGNEALTQRYFELMRTQKFLEGCSLGFLVLAVGALIQGFTIRGYLNLGLALASGSAVLVLLSPLFAGLVAKEKRQLSEMAQKYAAV
jgi:hypothetical protein